MSKSSNELRQLIDETLKAHEVFVRTSGGSQPYPYLNAIEGAIKPGIGIMPLNDSDVRNTGEAAEAIGVLARSAPTLAQELRLARRRNKKLRKQIDVLLCEIEETFRGGKHSPRVATKPTTGIEMLRLIHGYVIMQNAASHSFFVWREATEAWAKGEIEATSVHDARKKHLAKFEKGAR